MSLTKTIIVRQGDTLPAIASRELRDPARWYDLAQLNGLRLPFVCQSYRAADRLPQTVIWGDRLLVPWDGHTPLDQPPAAILGTDLALPRGALTVTAGGDLATVTAADNITQALAHRLRTLRGELLYHAAYGCLVEMALGLPAGPFSSLMAAAWVQEALADDPRVARVRAVEARVTGDRIDITATVDTVDDNTRVDLNLVLNP